MEKVAIFSRYPLQPGQKIRIEDGPRRGDWQVIDVGERTMRLRCPVSGKEVQWDRFCTLVVEQEREWPQP
jgi:hypothetical protein